MVVVVVVSYYYYGRPKTLYCLRVQGTGTCPSHEKKRNKKKWIKGSYDVYETNGGRNTAGIKWLLLFIFDKYSIESTHVALGMSKAHLLSRLTDLCCRLTHCKLTSNPNTISWDLLMQSAIIEGIELTNWLTNNNLPIHLDCFNNQLEQITGNYFFRMNTIVGIQRKTGDGVISKCPSTGEDGLVVAIDWLFSKRLNKVNGFTCPFKLPRLVSLSRNTKTESERGFVVSVCLDCWPGPSIYSRLLLPSSYLWKHSRMWTRRQKVGGDKWKAYTDTKWYTRTADDEVAPDPCCSAISS